MIVTVSILSRRTFWTFAYIATTASPRRMTIINLTPMLGALILLFVPKENKDAIRWVANFFALLGLLVSIPLVPMFWDKRFEPGLLD